MHNRNTLLCFFIILELNLDNPIWMALIKSNPLNLANPRQLLRDIPLDLLSFELVGHLLGGKNMLDDHNSKPIALLIDILIPC